MNKNEPDGLKMMQKKVAHSGDDCESVVYKTYYSNRLHIMEYRLFMVL